MPGLITAVVAGAVAAVFGGSRLQVSGPTGAMTVVLIPLVALRGPGVVLPLAVLAGLALLLAAALRLGRLLAYIPWPLVEGFTVGIAVVIAAQQVPSALGVLAPQGENAVVAAVVATGSAVRSPNWAVLALLAVALLLTAGLPRVHRTLPASLIAVVCCSLVNQVFDLGAARIGALPQGFPVPALPDVGGVAPLIGPALVVAFLAGLESLLSARVADGMGDGSRHHPDRELFGQGLANVASGLCGGMPATGAIARTAVNARAGASTRLAALTHALVLGLVVFSASGLVEQIPLVSLAAVLMVTAWRMVERHNVLAVLRSTPGDACIMVLTAACTVAFDLVTAVGVGLAFAAVLALRHLAATARAVPEPWARREVDTATEHALLVQHVLTYRLDGPLFFGASARFLSELTAVADVEVVILRLSAMRMLDATGAQALGEIITQLGDRGITVIVKGASDEHWRLLAAVGALASVRERRHVFRTLPEATAHAARHVAHRGRTGQGCPATSSVSVVRGDAARRLVATSRLTRSPDRPAERRAPRHAP